VIASVRNPALDIAFASMVPVSSLLLLWVLCTRGSNHPLADSAIA